MNYPIDWSEDLRNKPICGVLAVAMIAGVPFASATDAIKRNMLPHQKRHTGATYLPQLEATLRDFGKTIITETPARMTLRKWVREYSKPGTTYLVLTTKHATTVRDGLVADQCEIAHADVHNARRCFVRQVIEVL